jgi:hypothetical protein
VPRLTVARAGTPARPAARQFVRPLSTLTAYSISLPSIIADAA